MRIFILFFFTVIISLLLQGVVLRLILPSLIVPDLILILIVYLALKYPTVGGVFGVFALGLIQDFASGEFIGPNAGGAVVAFVLILTVSNRIYVERGPGVILLSLFASFVKSTTSLLMLDFYSKVGVYNFEIWRTVAIEALLSALIAPLVLRFLGAVTSRVKVRVVKPTESLRWT